MANSRLLIRSAPSRPLLLLTIRRPSSAWSSAENQSSVFGFPWMRLAPPSRSPLSRPRRVRLLQPSCWRMCRLEDEKLWGARRAFFLYGGCEAHTGCCIPAPRSCCVVVFSTPHTEAHYASMFLHTSHFQHQNNL